MWDFPHLFLNTLNSRSFFSTLSFKRESIYNTPSQTEALSSTYTSIIIDTFSSGYASYSSACGEDFRYKWTHDITGVNMRDHFFIGMFFYEQHILWETHNILTQNFESLILWRSSWRSIYIGAFILWATHFVRDTPTKTLKW